MTGEEILRQLACERSEELARISPEHQQSARLSARPFLSGAFHALVLADAFEDEPSLGLLQELLVPIEQPLVDAGVIEWVSFGFEERATVGLAEPDDEVVR